MHVEILHIEGGPGLRGAPETQQIVAALRELADAE